MPEDEAKSEAGGGGRACADESKTERELLTMRFEQAKAEGNSLDTSIREMDVPAVRRVGELVLLHSQCCCGIVVLNQARIEHIRYRIPLMKG